ncbi:MAG TPA: argininosuccinate synthase [Actinomycetota bacterium]|nr:argininosuccinate synthase [Actinomycetota bacterium]
MTGRVVLAYSGGLDTSVAARSLREERGVEVIAALVDLGQPYDADEVRRRADAAGAELRIVDARQAFAQSFCLPALHANALYEGKYPLISALARPLIAAEVIRIAQESGAVAVAHGCTGKGNDQVRFETTFAALGPDLQVLAPVREAARSREESLELARTWGIPVSSEANTYSVDENLWGRTVECGPLEDPWSDPPSDAFALTTDPNAAPDQGVEVTVSFEAGTPVAVDGEPLSMADAVARLDHVGGGHGFGRIDMIENRLVGIKSRELYEAPGALALIAAHRDLEDLTLERDLAHEKSSLERRWAELCYYGQWHGPLHGALRAFMAETQQRVTGEVRLRFYKGSCSVAGRRSPTGLYDLSLATYDRDADRFDHRQAQGFVALWSLPLRVWAGRTAGTSEAVGTARAKPEPTEAPSPAVSPAPSRVDGPAADHPAAGLDPRREGDGQSNDEPTRTETVWSGRFTEGPAPEAATFTRSTLDRRLIGPDLLVTRAHATALNRAGLLDGDSLARLTSELDGLMAEAAAGRFPFRDDDEDVHVAVERVLTERLGDLGARIHAGRSRNDLVATDLRLWIKEATTELAGKVRGLAAALVERSEQHADDVMPGYTHLQRAQPVTLGHHLLAHAFPLLRDVERFERASRAADTSPLGAGALAGSSLGIDPAGTAQDLGFGGPFENSIDAVADRDFAVEFLAACLHVALHLSRLGEDLVLWTSQEFAFARPADAHATGSSSMPQKRNPDVAELARAQAGRVLGDLVALATVLKGLPIAYDRDLQEDKAAVFDAHDVLAPALEAVRAMISTLAFDTERMRAAAQEGFILATDLAEGLVRVGVPFREAHEQVGKLVAHLESDGRTLLHLTEQEREDLGAQVGPMSAEASVAARRTPGGPSPESVRHQVAALRSRLSR